MDQQKRAADAIRVLSMDAVQKANSGHPGMPMGMADLATVLWGRHLIVDPTDPHWLDRDRFVVSNGHGSMLLYAVLHLSGFDLSMDDIRNFRQWGHPTAGHPEIEVERGIEMTTGPLGQGFGSAIGMAVAEAQLEAKFGSDLVDHKTYVFCSDGDLMEGVAAEAASLAGHLELGKVIAIYDDNHISLEGPTSWTFTENVVQRFESYGWHTIVVDGHDHVAIDQAIEEAKSTIGRPTLIDAKTHIGFGSPNKQDSAKAHGSPLGDDEIALVRQELGWDLPPFEIPEDVYKYFHTAMQRGTEARQAWDARHESLISSGGELAADWAAHFDPQPVRLDAPSYEAGKAAATRAMSGKVIQQIGEQRMDFITGDADLAGSTKSLIDDASDFSKEDRTGRNIRYGVREHAMGAMVNGMNIHGGVRAFGSTFLTFSDYMRGSVRLGALMETPSIWVWTHDSIFLGEDGPTHQSIEHVAALRAIPELWVFRPATPGEVAGSWQAAMNRLDGPSALILTRQNLPIPAEDVAPDAVAKGGYIALPGTDATIVATGSELHVAMQAAGLLGEHGLSIRVVSMPCLELFEAQGDSYRRQVLGDGIPVASIEAATTFGWAAITGADGLRIGIDHFGASAPYEVLAEQYGFTPRAVAERLAGWLGRS
ncbi:MAG: transketolase [Acidimicrobiia bacterium]|nr:transketolase [Acidimicrobiia bacterium]